MQKKLFPLGVSGPDELFRSTFEIPVISFFDPFEPLRVETRKPDQMGGQLAVGIKPLRLFDEKNTFDARCLDQRRLLGRNFSGQPAEAFRLGDFFVYLFTLQIEQ